MSIFEVKKQFPIILRQMLRPILRLIAVVFLSFSRLVHKNNRSLKTCILVLVVPFFLSACDGGGKSKQISTTPPPSDTPPPVPDTGTIKVTSFDYVQLSSGDIYDPGQVQSTDFTNATGEIRLPLPGQNLTGNLTISVDLSDADGIKYVYYGFTGTTVVGTLCDSLCGTVFNNTITGINPLDFGVTSGNQRLELWVGDDKGNLVTVSTVSFDWNVTPVTAITATRLNNTINLSWKPLNNYLQYNVYMASEPNVTPDNYQSLSDGQAYFALNEPRLSVDGTEDSKSFYVLVSGIDKSGESAFGEPIAILALSEIFDLPPDAVDDVFSMNEEQLLTAGLLDNDSDLESEFVSIDTIPVIEPKNGQVTIKADGTFTYQPNIDFSGRDGFTYQISDDVGNTDIAVVAISVIQVNDPPQPSFNNYNIDLDAVAAVTSSTKTSYNSPIFNLSAAATELIVLAPGLLINDLDVDSGQLSVLLDPVEGPFQGTLILQEDGGFSYTPDAEATDTDTFTYRTIDSTGATADSVVLITIDGGNFFPVAANDRYTLNQDETFSSTISINNPSILSNDFDLDTQDTLTLVTQLKQSTAHGQLNLASDGTFTYTPDAGYYGIDSFIYQISDPQDARAEAAVILTIVKRNNPPFAIRDTYQPIEDAIFSANAQRGVLANDADPDFDPKFATITPVEPPIHGQLTLAVDGSFSYMPDENFFGTDSFRYEVKDDKGLAAIGTVILTVINVNDNPVAFDDNARTGSNTQVIVDVLDNDSDIDGNILNVDSATVPANQGSVIVDSDETLTFIPTNNFEGLAEIDYTISDGEGGSASAKVFIAVNLLNLAPTAFDDNYTATEDRVLNVNGNNQPRLLANDSDPDGDALSVGVQPLTDVSHGALSLSSNGTFNYRPDDDFFGEDFFVYQIRDNLGGVASATATLNITSVNDAPQALDDNVDTAEETRININVLFNDSDPDNDTLIIASASSSQGTTTVLANNTLDFTPELNFVGIAEINYRISDGNQSLDSAVVTVDVQNINDAPIANNDFSTTIGGISVAIDVLTNDSDIDGDNLTVIQATANNGSTVINGGTSVTYTADSDFSGTDNVSYFISDGNGGTDNANISITVLANSNASPVANNDIASTFKDVPIEINALANDEDPEGDELSIVEANATLGSVSILDNNNLRFVPLAGFIGTDTISYNIDDGRGGLASAIVTVTIADLVSNSPPIASNDSATTDEDTALSINVLNNDSDVDNDTLTVDSATATFGTVSIAANNNLNYQPFFNFFGADTISYSINDGQGGSSSASVTITVVPVNDSPVAAADTATANEDTLLNINVLDNDSDVDSATLTVSTVTAQNGVVEVQPNQTLNYLANANFFGTDTINYTLLDGDGGVASATVSVTINPVNDLPMALNDIVTTNEEVAVEVNVLLNDTDIDGDTLVITSATAAHGSSVINAEQSLVIYTPELDYTGTDTINYTLLDGDGGVASATVSVTINPVNDLPMALNDIVTTNEEVAVEVNVLLNDTDIDGDTLVITSATAAHGSSVINAEQSLVIYTPELDYTGPDIITYVISDQQGGSATANVDVTVFDANDNPIANADVATTTEDTLVNIDVLINDTDLDSEILTITAGQAANGTVTITQNNTLNYTPKLNYNGQDIIAYTINDNEGGTATSTATVTITPVNDAPVAVADTATTDEDSSAIIAVLDNDSDPDSDTLTVSVDSTSNGGIVINPDNTLSFFPQDNFHGQASIEYTINDGNGSSASATVTITVNPLNDQPVAANDTSVTQEDQPVTINVLANDSDIEEDTLTVLITSASNGQASLDNASIIFAPAADYNGPAQIQYSVSDGNGGNANATVAITVVAVNDAPIAVADNKTTDEDTSNTLTVLANDFDVDGDTLTITTALADNGRVIINPDQTLVYIPIANFNGIDLINYTISDPSGSTATAEVTMAVTSINDQPVTLDDRQSLDEDISTTLDVLANDSDLDLDTLTIIAASSNDGSLSINDSANGQTLQFVPNRNFNGETKVSYTITDNDCTVLANCGAGHTASATVTLTVNPINDAPSIAATTATIAENVVNGFSVVTMAGEDIENDPLNYAITNGNTDSIFAINSSSGEVIVADKSFLDFETTQQYTLTITVTDTSKLTDSTDLVITISEVLENQTLVADSSFGNTSVSGLAASNAFAFDNSDTPLDAVMDSTGRVIMVGTVSASTTDFTVTRYLADGHLDHSFGVQGVLNKDLGGFESATAVTVDASDNIYIAGELFNQDVIEIFVIKLLASGAPDNDFGNSGIAISRLGQSNLLVAGIIVNTDGNIIVGAGVNNQFTLYQYDASSGIVSASTTLDMTGEFDRPQAITRQSDGKILIGGFTADANNNFNYDFAVARLNSDLSLDTSFATNGTFTFDLGQLDDDIIYDIKVDSSGNIALLGSTTLAQDVNDVALAMMDSSGALSSDFGAQGIQIIDADQDGGSHTNSSVGKRLAIDSSNNLYLGVQLGLTDQGHDIGIVKITAAGEQDSSFGSNGIVAKDIGNDENTLAGLVLDSNSRVIIATSVKGTRNQNFALARFDTSGTLDSSFVNRGFNTSNQTPSDDTLYDSIELTSSGQSGKIAMVGSSNSNNSVTDLIVARYTTNGSLDSTFAVDGYYRRSDNSASAYIGKAVAELSDGRLIVTGWFGDQGFVLMLDSNGKADSSFDNDGIRLFSATDNNLQLAFNGIAIDSNNKIVIGGYARNLLSDNSDIYLSRLNLDGSFDTSFGSGGETIQDLNQLEQINNISVLSDNSVIVVGRQFSTEQAQDDKALIAKFTSAGSLDSAGFGSGGFQSLDLDTRVANNQDILFDVVTSNGIIYASGSSISPTGDLTSMVSLTANGLLNSGFNGAGLATFDFGTSQANRSLALDLSGKLLLTGTSVNTTDGGDDVYIARLKPDGTQDPLFNKGNAFMISYHHQDSSEVIIALANGSIMITGHNQITGYANRVWYLQTFNLVQ